MSCRWTSSDQHACQIGWHRDHARTTTIRAAYPRPPNTNMLACEGPTASRCPETPQLWSSTLARSLTPPSRRLVLALAYAPHITTAGTTGSIRASLLWYLKRTRKLTNGAGNQYQKRFLTVPQRVPKLCSTSMVSIFLKPEGMGLRRVRGTRHLVNHRSLLPIAHKGSCLRARLRGLLPMQVACL